MLPVLLALLAMLVPATSGAASGRYEAYGSCATSKPFAHARHCAFDGAEHAGGTFVFQSHAGKRELKVCQKIYGLSFKGRQCIKGKKATAYEAIPFELDHAYDSFRVVVTFYVKKPHASGPYEQVARVPLRFG